MSLMNHNSDLMRKDVEEAKSYFLRCLDSGIPSQEDDRDRWFRLWAMPWEGWTKPNRAELMALGSLIGTGVMIAEVLDIASRDWRYLASGNRPISWTRWHLMLEAAGFGSILRKPPLRGLRNA